MKLALMTAGAKACTVAPRLGVLTGANGEIANADFSFLTGASVLFDAVYVPGGEASIASLKAEPEALNFLREAYKHCKPIAASDAGIDLLEDADVESDPGVIVGRDGAKLAKDFINAISLHRHWEREGKV
jgi:catalase